MDPVDELKSRIAELTLKADPGAWRAAGFDVEGDRTRIGTVPVRFGDRSGWVLDGPRSADFDALPTQLGTAPGGEPAPEHPNSVVSIDHIVIFSSSLERTIEAFEAAGVRCRRVRETGTPEQPLRQGFFRFGEVIAELVQVPVEQAGPDGAARFWGLTLVAADLDGVAAELGPLCGTIRDAVQPGRRIATIKREAGLGLPVALITPDVREDAPPGAGAGGADPVLPPVRRS